MTRGLLTHSQQAYVLSLNIITHDHTGYALTTIPLVRLTSLIFCIWSILQTTIRLWLTLKTFPNPVLNFCEWFYLQVEACRKLLPKTLVENYGRAI